MASIRSGNTRIELALRRALWASGIRGYRVGPSGIPGKPDIFFPRIRYAVFVNGCFWHCCRRCYREPTTNVRFWRKKISQNRARDKAVVTELRRRGFTVQVFWEHQVRDNLSACVKRIFNVFHELA